MAKSLVVKDNALINASYNLELVEQRLILLSIIEARATSKGITPNDKLTITASSYMNHFNTNRNASYKALKEASNNLFERQFSFIERTEKGDKVVRTRWVSQVAYLENEAMVELIFSPAVAPLITLLEKNFTSYELEQVSELNSKYAVRLYEVVIAWRSIGKTPMISIDELRDRLGVLDNEYQRMEVLKRKVIDFAIKQINEKTNIKLTYEQHKQGRRIIGFTFIVKQKANTKSKKENETRDGNTPDMFSPIKMTDKQRQTFSHKLAELSELGEFAPTGMSMKEYAKQIENDLLDPKKVEFYRKYLTKVGFMDK